MPTIPDTLVRPLTLVLVAGLVIGVGGAVHGALSPSPTTDATTEFSFVKTGDNATVSPAVFTVGERGGLIVRIANHEHRNMTYTVGVVHNGTVHGTVQVTIVEGATVERTVPYTPQSAGTHRVRILLYRGTSLYLGKEPYRQLQVGVTVRE